MTTKLTNSENVEKKEKPKLTQARVRELFDYDPLTGIVTRKITVGHNAKAGDKVGIKHKSEYLFVSIDDKMYYLHRVIWMHVHGYFPEYELDHGNRCRWDNALSNLREVSPQCNIRNTGLRSDNKSGVKGVTWKESSNKWLVQIAVKEANYYLGMYTDFTEAVAHRLAAEQALNWSGCDSTSSAFLYMQTYLKDLANK